MISNHKYFPMGWNHQPETFPTNGRFIIGFTTSGRLYQTVSNIFYEQYIYISTCLKLLTYAYTVCMTYIYNYMVKQLICYLGAFVCLKVAYASIISPNSVSTLLGSYGKC